MKKILIADSSKPSIVMTSEVFKDHFPGVQVLLAKSSQEALEVTGQNGDLDAVIVDYDLPDETGSALAQKLKRLTTAPVLITAFESADVKEDIERNLAAYDDCLNWIRKPIKADNLAQVARRFCEGKIRTHRRIFCDIPMQVLLDVSFDKDLPQKEIKPLKKTTPNSTKNKPKAVVVGKALKQKKPTQKKKPIAKKPAQKVLPKAKTKTLAKKKTPDTKSNIKVFSQKGLFTKRKITQKKPLIKKENTKEISKKNVSQKTPIPAVTFITKKIWLNASLEDCSIHGLKMSIPRSQIKKLNAKDLVGFGKTQSSTGQMIKIRMPALALLEKELPPRILGSSQVRHSPLTLNDDNNTSLEAKIVWSAAEKDFFAMGLQAQDDPLVARLFALLASLERQVRDQNTDADAKVHQEGSQPEKSGGSGVLSLSAFSTRKAPKRGR